MEKVLIIVDRDFEDREFVYPYYRFQEAGYEVVVVGPKANTTYVGEYGIKATTDLAPEDVKIEEYVAVIISGGRAPDRMRRNEGLVQLVEKAFERGKVVAAICHGPQLLIEAGVLKGKRVTCFRSISTDIKNAGGIYEDKTVVVDGNLVTSRQPSDLPDFCREVIKLLQT